MSGARRRAAGKAAAPPRVVFDTGLLLRALLLGEFGALRHAWQQGRCTALVDAASARALMTALAAPALKLSAAQQQELLADYLPYAEVVPGDAKPPRGTARLAALERLALGLAREGKAAYLVSDSAALQAWFERGGSAVAELESELLESEQFFASC